MDEFRYTKCSCQHCGGHISFDPNNLAEGETPKVLCPHCHKETVLTTPHLTHQTPKATVLQESSNTKKTLVQNVWLVIKNARFDLKNGGDILLAVCLAVFLLCSVPLLGMQIIPAMALIGLIFVCFGICAYTAGKQSALSFVFSGGGVSLLALFAFILEIAIQTHTFHLQTRTNQISSQSRADEKKVLWATSLTAKQGDIQITISEVSVRHMRSGLGEVPAYNTTNLCVKMEIINMSETNKHSFIEWRIKQQVQEQAVRLNSWTLGDNRQHAFWGFVAEETGDKIRPAILSDSSGNQYKQCDYSWHNNPFETSIYPNCYIIQGFVFERPVKNSRWFHLELPAENFGGSGVLRFEIPITKVEVGDLN